MLTSNSGVTHRFILLQQELFSHQETFTTSETLATDIRPFNIAQPMRQRDSWTGYPTSKKRQWMKRNAGKKTSIGQLPTRQKRTAWVVGASVILTYLRLKVNKEAAFLNG